MNLRTATELTPADLKSPVGSQRIDVVGADSAAFGLLADTLRWDGFEVTPDHEQRTLQVAAPGGLADLARLSAVVAASGIAVDEVALRRFNHALAE